MSCSYFFENEKDKFCFFPFVWNIGSARGGCEEFDGKSRDRGVNSGILASSKYSQNETYRNRNNDEEKIGKFIEDI